MSGSKKGDIAMPPKTKRMKNYYLKIYATRWQDTKYNIDEEKGNKEANQERQKDPLDEVQMKYSKIKKLCRKDDKIVNSIQMKQSEIKKLSS